MAQVRLLSSPCYSLLNVAAMKSMPTGSFAKPQVSKSRATKLVYPNFKHGTPLSFIRRKSECQARSVCIRCGQSTKESNGLDVWLGRLAMVGFATAITVEIATGKGLLENFGFITPLPTLALIVTALIGVLTAFFIFQSASRD